MLEDIVVKRLKSAYSDLDKQGALLSLTKLNECYALFKQRFGPQVLATIDGDALLEAMHGRGNDDSLMYWLEF